MMSAPFSSGSSLIQAKYPGASTGETLKPEFAQGSNNNTIGFSFNVQN